MEYVFAQPAQPDQRQAAVLAVSAFDGVHREQQRLLAEAGALAQQAGVALVALLPWPPFTEEAAPDGLLTTLAERLALVEAHAPSAQVVILPADVSSPWAPASLIERITSGWDVNALVVDPSADEQLCGIELAEAARQHGLRAVDLSPSGDNAAPAGACIRSASVVSSPPGAASSVNGGQGSKATSATPACCASAPASASNRCCSR